MIKRMPPRNRGLSLGLRTWIVGSLIGVSLVCCPASAGTSANSINPVVPVDTRMALVDARGFPRLLGMNIAKDTLQLPTYQANLARLDVVILGFYPGWNKLKSPHPIRDAVRAIKALNPNLLVGLYTVLNEAQGDQPRYAMYRDKAFKLNKENWWLRKADGNKTQWTNQYDAWDINITEWTKPDFNNMRYPEWLAERDYRLFFGPTPEFDIWYFDNVMSFQRIEKADWDLDGQDETGKDQRIQAAFQHGMASHWDHARKLAPKLLLMGNTDNDLSSPAYMNQLQGAFLEGLMGHSWSLEHGAGWGKMMDRYHSVFANLAAPRLVGFNVSGQVDNYQFFRYAYTSCLLDDGYFSYTDEKVGYSSVPWFDEYDVKLGKAVDPPQLRPWRDGVYRRRFDYGLVMANPTDSKKRVVVEAGYRRLTGRQAPEVNNGSAVSELIIPARDGIVLIQNR